MSEAEDINKRIQFLEKRNFELEKENQLLFETKEKLKMIIDNSGEGVGIVDKNETFIFANKAAECIFGVSENMLQGCNLNEFIHPDSAHIIKEQSQYRQKGEKSSYEIVIIRKDGEMRNLLVTATPYFEANDEYAGAFGIFRDITHLKKYEAELIMAKEKAEESDRLKSVFLANVSHELRTPLNGILGFTNILKEELNDKYFIEMVDFIEKSGNRLLETINSIIDFSVLESKKIKTQMAMINLNELLHEITKYHCSSASIKNLYLTYESPDKNIIVNTDERLLKQLMDNLISNAIKYTVKGGIIVELDYKIAENQKTAIINVKDTGIGIPEEKIPYIFKEFRQVSEGYNRAFEGSGLGLSICSGIVKLLGGEISVESTVNKGSTFSVSIPADEINEIQIPEDDNMENNQLINKKNKPLILLVEDDDTNRQFTFYSLRNFYQVHIACDGITAIEMASKIQYDAILMDINLGKEMNGIEATKAIRNINGYEKTPIAAVTANVMPGMREEFLSNGCTHYLAKPFQVKEIRNLVREMLENQ
jgi:PAS domain S-box-containing protein